MDIRVSGLSKSFGARRVLSDFSAVFPHAEPTCLMGESGCGKTTLLSVLLGILPYDSGEISGTDCKMCAVFQEDRLAVEFTALENLRIVLPRTAPLSEAEACLAELGLSPDVAKKPITALSGGMARRVAIARALLAEGEWLILDEPFRGLDEENRRRAAACILTRRNGRGILLVSHDAEEAALLGARVMHMPTPL